jgi:hypothetical protein
LIIAFNGSDQAGTAPLRFADDDGVRYVEVLERLGMEVTLLTSPDEETAAEGAPALARAETPTPAHLDEAVARLASKAAADRQAGRRVEMLVVYVGHGALDDAGRAYLTLMGGRLDRDALYSKVVDPIGADVTHVVVDACRAAGVVGSRGADPRVLADLEGLLAREQQAQHPNVGVIYAESEDGRTHEWSRIHAGVLSHLVRSALLGAADVNHDGKIEYSELQAFVASALLGVQDARTRLQVHAAAPLREPHASLSGPVPRGPQLDLPADLHSTRITITDDDGHSLVDLNRAPGTRIELALPKRPGYWMRTPDGEAHLGADPENAPLPPLTPLTLSMRGSEEEALSRGWFSVSFDRSFYEGYAASSGLGLVSFGGEADKHQRPDGTVSGQPIGLELGAVFGQAPLGTAAVAGGIEVEWHSAPFAFGLRAGVRGAWSFSPNVWSTPPVSLHRLTVGPLLGWQGTGSWAPTAEVGLGWLAVLAPEPPPRGITGDLAGMTGRVFFGFAHAMGGLEFRAGPQIEVDLAHVGANRATQINALPGLTVGCAF